jgi:hypothetical protein
MTIMDRLARKGIVTRRKHGRAYVYAPSLSADEARAHTVAQVIEGFFDGSAESLVAHLTGGSDRAEQRGPRLVERASTKVEAATARRAATNELDAPKGDSADGIAPQTVNAAKLDPTLL